MEIFKLIEELKMNYKNDCRIRKNGTILLGSDQKLPLYSRHILFEPLTDELINEFLVNEYNYTFPKQYTTFLKYSNGMSLFTAKRKVGKYKVSLSVFTIYGLPRTQPFGRPQDMEEPFDVRVEDLGRHEEIPPQWLKCGSYKKEDDEFDITYDIFIDTVSEHIYSFLF